MLSEEPLLPKQDTKKQWRPFHVLLIGCLCCAIVVVAWNPSHVFSETKPSHWVPPEAAVGGTFEFPWGESTKNQCVEAVDRSEKPKDTRTVLSGTLESTGHGPDGGGGSQSKQCGYPENAYAPVSDQTPASGETTKSRDELIELCDGITRTQSDQLEDGPYKDAVRVLLDPTPENVGTDVYVLFWGALGVCQGHNAILYYSGGDSVRYESPWPFGAKVTDYGTNVWNNQEFKRADMPFPLDVMLEGTPHRQNYWEKDYAHFPEVIIKGTNWNADQKMGKSFSMGAWDEVSNCAWYTTQFLREIGIVLPNHKQWYRRWGPWRPSYVYQALREFSNANAKIQDPNKFPQPEFLFRPSASGISEQVQPGGDMQAITEIKRKFSEEDLNFYFESSHYVSTEIQSLFRKMFHGIAPGVVSDPHFLQED